MEENAVLRERYEKIGKERFEKVKEALWDSLKDEEKLKTLPPKVLRNLGEVHDLGESAILSILIEHFAYHLSFL